MLFFKGKVVMCRISVSSEFSQTEPALWTWLLVDTDNIGHLDFLSRGPGESRAPPDSQQQATARWLCDRLSLCRGPVLGVSNTTES